MRRTDNAPDRYALRDSAILHTLYSTGARASELCSISLDHVDQANQRILIRGKYKRERWVFLTPPAARALTSWLEQRHRYAQRHPFVFVNIPSGNPLSDRVLRLIVAERGAQALGPWQRVHPHMFRHSFATHIVDAGGDIADVARLMGHASLDSTMVYLHTAPNRLAAVVHDRLPQEAAS
jgi:integrase/recombinase XerC